MKICFKNDLGVEHCVEVPQIIRRWPDPDPDPWLHDLSALDLISQLAQQVNDAELAKSLSEVVSAHTERVQTSLPGQVRVETENVFR